MKINPQGRIMNKHEQKFINDVNEKYGMGKYTFEKMVYVNAHKQVELFCTDCNQYFLITPMQIVRKTAKGCNICHKNVPHQTDEFIKKCQEKYGNKYSYEKTVYVNQKTKVILFCNEHQDYIEVNPATLLNKNCDCGVCANRFGITTELFIKKAIAVHGDKYCYDLVEYKNSDTKIIIVCPEHGEFTQIPKAHVNGRGCPSCGEYGYQPSKPGYFYIQKLTNKKKTVYKYGITGDMKRRIHEQSRDSDFEHTVLVQRFFEDGHKPLVLEKFLKQYVDSGVVSTEELPSGFTETFDAKYLETVLEIVNTFE